MGDADVDRENRGDGASLQQKYNLQNRAEALELEIIELSEKLARKQNDLKAIRTEQKSNLYSGNLTSREISRYSRQMIMPVFGAKAQVNFKNSKILIIGVGGLGCPCALYLTAAGVGHIFLVDNDKVELSNIHRQILHTECNVGKLKVLSAYEKLSQINSDVKITPLIMRLDSDNATELFDKESFDLVIDASDNVPTRYLLNDICVVKNIPLVSGSAVQMEGQLTVYNYKNGPCYRCLFPIPSPPDTVATCGDNGVLGPVPGTIGVLQALEALKILSKREHEVLSDRLLTFDAYDCTFKCIKLRKRTEECKMCSGRNGILQSVDYDSYRGCEKVLHNLKSHEEISVDQLFAKNDKKLIIDVRLETEFEMCKLPDTINFPYDDICNKKNLEKLRSLIETAHSNVVYTLCRRGNDSRRAIMRMKEYFPEIKVSYVNVNGGLHAYARDVDPKFPVY